MLKDAMPAYTWVGIYLLDGDELVLGPFLGKPSPHTRIPLGQGICGAAATRAKTIIVDDVNADPRYLACSLETRSEIVVPIIHDGRVLGEIDIDSDTPAAFGAADRDLLEAVAGPTRAESLPTNDAQRSRSFPATGSDRKSRARSSACSRRRASMSCGRNSPPAPSALERARHDAAAAAARIDPQEQGGAEGPDHHADRRGLHQRERRSAQGARAVRQPAAGVEPAVGGRRASRTSISSSSAKTPKISTPASSTSSCRAWSRA